MLTQEMVADVPSDPGVYFFRGVTGTILYIGKAKSLRKRVRSYLHKVKKTPNQNQTTYPVDNRCSVSGVSFRTGSALLRIAVNPRISTLL